MDLSTRNSSDTRRINKKTTNSIGLMQLGKIPPQSVDLEEAVLGAIMLDNEALYSVAPILKDEMFYKEAHQRIFKAINTLFQRNEIPDILTVTQELKRNGDLEIAGGAYYVTTLTNRIASSSNVQVHARIVMEKFLQRELIRISTETLQQSYEDTSDVFELIENNEKALGLINDNIISDKAQTASEVMDASLVHIIDAKKNDGLTGIASGIYQLDLITHGWQKGKLYILAARPGCGKSSAMLNFAVNSYTHSKAKSLIFSLEMNNEELGVKIISSISGVSHYALSRGTANQFDMDKVMNISNEIRRYPIFFDDRVGLTINQLKTIARKYKRKEKIDIIFIDYMQLIKGSKTNQKFREQEIAEVSIGCKNLSKELNIPIVALAQLSREVDKRVDKKPQLSDLRESGSLEMDADVVIFIYRPAVYGIEEDGDGNDIKNKAKLIIAKHRAGRLGEVNVNFNGDISKFSDEDTSISPV